MYPRDINTPHDASKIKRVRIPISFFAFAFVYDVRPIEGKVLSITVTLPFEWRLSIFRNTRWFIRNNHIEAHFFM